MFMIVTIPALKQHEGIPSALITLKISHNCPKCGKKRGKIYGTHSYDGSRRLNCDGWTNPCGHVDSHEDIRKEGELTKYKAVAAFGKYEDGSSV